LCPIDKFAELSRFGEELSLYCGPDEGGVGVVVLDEVFDAFDMM
jgi:hypothetical protein